MWALRSAGPSTGFSNVAGPPRASTITDVAGMVPSFPAIWHGVYRQMAPSASLLLVAERDLRIGSRGAPGGEKTCPEGDSGEHEGEAHEGERVGRLDREEEAR